MHDLNIGRCKYLHFTPNIRSSHEFGCYVIDTQRFELISSRPEYLSISIRRHLLRFACQVQLPHHQLQTAVHPQTIPLLATTMKLTLPLLTLTVTLLSSVTAQHCTVGRMSGFCNVKEGEQTEKDGCSKHHSGACYHISSETESRCTITVYGGPGRCSPTDPIIAVLPCFQGMIYQVPQGVDSTYIVNCTSS